MPVQSIECQLVRAQIGRYLSGEPLSQESMRQLEVHLVACDECRAALAVRKSDLRAKAAAEGGLKTRTKQEPIPTHAVVQDRTEDEPAPKTKSKIGLKPNSFSKPLIMTVALGAVLITMSRLSGGNGLTMGPNALSAFAGSAATPKTQPQTPAAPVTQPSTTVAQTTLTAATSTPATTAPATTPATAAATTPTTTPTTTPRTTPAPIPAPTTPTTTATPSKTATPTTTASTPPASTNPAPATTKPTEAKPVATITPKPAAPTPAPTKPEPAKVEPKPARVHHLRVAHHKKTSHRTLRARIRAAHLRKAKKAHRSAARVRVYDASGAPIQ